MIEFYMLVLSLMFCFILTPLILIKINNTFLFMLLVLERGKTLVLMGKMDQYEFLDWYNKNIGSTAKLFFTTNLTFESYFNEEQLEFLKD